MAFAPVCLTSVSIIPGGVNLNKDRLCATSLSLRLFKIGLNFPGQLLAGGVPFLKSRKDNLA
jgi:hypothetical protein